MPSLKAEVEVAEVLLGLAPKIIEHLHEGVVIVDDSLTICYVNASAEWTFDAHRSQLNGQPLNSLIPERFREKHDFYMRQYLQHPTVRTMGRGVALFGISRSGNEFPVEISLNPHKTPLGTFVVALIHSKDVSPQ